LEVNGEEMPEERDFNAANNLIEKLIPFAVQIEE